MLSGFLNKKILTESAVEVIDLDGKVTTVDDKDKLDSKLDNMEVNPMSQSEAEEVVEEMEQKLDEIDEDNQQNSMVESAINLFSDANEIYLLMENTVCKIRSKAVELSLLEAAGTGDTDALKDKAKKLASGAGRTLLNNLLASLKQLILKVQQHMNALKLKLIEFTGDTEKWSKTVSPRVEEKAKDSNAVRNFTYNGYSWNLGSVSIDDAEKILDTIDTIIPSSIINSNSVDAINSKLKELDGWTLDDFRNKMVKDCLKLKSSQDLVKVINTSLRGGEEAKEIRGFSASKGSPITMLATINQSKAIVATQVAVENRIVSKLNAHMQATEEILNKAQKADDALANAMSHYASKRISILNIGITLVNLVASMKIEATKQMITEFMRALNSFAK